MPLPLGWFLRSALVTVGEVNRPGYSRGSKP